MQAGFEQAACDRRMQVGRRQHMGDIGNAGRDQLLDIAIDVGDAPLGGPAFRQPQIAVDDRDKFSLRDRGFQYFDVSCRDKTGPDQGGAVASH